MATLAEVEVAIKTNMAPLIQGSREAEKRIRELEGKLEKLSKAPRTTQSEFKKLNNILRTTSTLVGTLAGSVAAGLFARAVREFATFEQGLKNVQAVSGATTKELEQLSNAALKAAATTRFNPKQTTDALYALASSGQNAREQIASLPNVLNFAEAAQADLGQATEIVTSTLNVFGIKARESKRVVDVFTASIGASALNARRIAVAMRNAGPTAAALGQSFEQTTASLAILTSAFGNGERAGTGLRAILVEVGDKAKALGIKVKNSKGDFLPLVDIIRQIEKRGITATQIIETFGAEAGPALAALLSKGSKALEEMEANLKSNGQAAAVAASQLDTLSGDLAGLGSAISAAMVSIGQSQSGMLREIVQSITNLIRYWSGYADTLGDAEEKTKSLSNIISVIAGMLAVRVVAGALSAASAMGVLNLATKTLAISLRVLGLTNPIGILVTAVGAATYAFLQLQDTILPIQGDIATLGDYGVVVWQKMAKGAEAVADVIGKKISSAAKLASDIFAEVSSQIATFISEALGGSEISFAGFADFVKTVANRVIGVFVAVYGAIAGIFTKLPAAIAEGVVVAMNAMISVIERWLNVVVDGFNAVIKSINSFGGKFGLTMPLLGNVELGRIPNYYAGSGKELGETIGEEVRKAFVKAFDENTEDYLGDAFSSLRTLANQRARARADTEENGPGVAAGLGSSLADARGSYAGGGSITPPPKIGGGGGPGGGGGQNSYQREVEQIKNRTKELLAQYEAQSKINPLINDYGYALEEASAKQQLVTAAQKAGIRLTPELKAKIDELAAGYAKASVNAKQLEENQEKIRQRAEEMKSFGADVFKGFISDLREGKSASEALANALDKVADKLIDIAINSLFGIGGGGGGGGGGGLGKILGSILGAIFGGGGGVPGHASGTANTGGRRGEPRGVVHGQEAVIPLPGNGKVPVDIRMPTGLTSPQVGSAAQKVDLTVSLESDDSVIAGIADTRIKNAAPGIVRISVQEGQKTTRQNLPGMMAEAQTRNF